MSYIIAIPSYKRAETLKTKTLTLLREHKIPHELINIFVANEEEVEIYKKTLDPQSYGSIIKGVIGMRAIRNFIQDWYPEGAKIVNIDDDVQAIKVRQNNQECKDLQNLDSLINEGFGLVEKYKCSLWG